MSHLDLLSALRGRGKNRKQKSQKYLATANTTDCLKRNLLGTRSSFAANEAYKATRTNLLFTRVGEGCQILAVTSTFPGEGKTINCCNLAISVAQNGQRVLIIDADMRRPMVANLFGIPNRSGLSEFLAGLAAPNADGAPLSMPLVRTKYPNLSVIPSGHIPPNSAELLASARMKSLLSATTKYFDYIFIDTPPISLVTDAAVLAKNVQGYVFVVRAGVTPLENLRNEVAKMEQLGANILGFVLNDLDVKSGSYKYNSYHLHGKYGDKRYGGKYAYSRAGERETDYEISAKEVERVKNS